MRVDLRNNMISIFSAIPACLYAILGFYKGDHGVIVSIDFARKRTLLTVPRTGFDVRPKPPLLLRTPVRCFHNSRPPQGHQNLMAVAFLDRNR